MVSPANAVHSGRILEGAVLQEIDAEGRGTSLDLELKLLIVANTP